MNNILNTTTTIVTPTLNASNIDLSQVKPSYYEFCDFVRKQDKNHIIDNSSFNSCAFGMYIYEITGGLNVKTDLMSLRYPVDVWGFPEIIFEFLDFGYCKTYGQLRNVVIEYDRILTCNKVFSKKEILKSLLKLCS